MSVREFWTRLSMQKIMHYARACEPLVGAGEPGACMQCVGAGKPRACEPFVEAGEPGAC